MNLDFSFSQHMRMSSVKRWVIIEMSRAQSVAEHSFNVAVIANGLLDKLALDIIGQGPSTKFDDSYDEWKEGQLASMRADVLEWALMHDLPEVLTGDIPSPVKTHLSSAIASMEGNLFPGYGNMKRRLKGTVVETLVKLADYIDAIQFAKRFCIDPKRAEILSEMSINMEGVIYEAEKKYGIPVRQAVEAVWRE